MNQDLANGYCCFVFLLASFLVWVMARGVSCPFPRRRGLGHDDDGDEVDDDDDDDGDDDGDGDDDDGTRQVLSFSK